MEFFTDAEATRFLFPENDPGTFAEAWMQRQIRRYDKTGTGLSAIELRETGELIGQGGLILQFVQGIPKLEIGYHFIRRFWGQGYATEAAIASRDFAFENDLAETVVSLIHPENLRSQAVAKKSGMALKKATTWGGRPALVFRITRDMWESLKNNLS
jgi:RimJ/RimL family protein N-acetyltransferase